MSESRGVIELPDVNVLVALTNPSHQHHDQAHEWLEGVGRFATCPPTESGLVRLLLNRVVTGQVVTGQQALRILAGVRAHAKAAFLADDTTLAEPRIDLVGLASHRQATDLHLVNLAATHAAVLATFDRRLPQMLTERDQALVRVL